MSIRNSDRYERHFKYLKETKIPVPPIPIQDKIIEECSKIDNEYQNVRKQIDDYDNKIKQAFVAGEQSTSNYVRLNDREKFEISIGNRIFKIRIN